MQDQFWLINYRLYDSNGDDKSKLDHVHDMLSNVVHHKRLPFHAVLMDTWYATKGLMLFIESLQKVYYCPLKANRQVDDSGGVRPYQRVDALTWAPAEQRHGKRGFPKDHKVQLFRVEVSIHRTDWVMTNDRTQHSTTAAQQGVRLSLEDRATAPRRQTGHRTGTLPMPHGPHSTQSYRLCIWSGDG
jgi:hypothetical protein